MKKLSILFLLAAFVFTGCSDDDKATVVLSFEGKLTEANSEFISESANNKDTFQDNGKLLTFNHEYNYYGDSYYFSAFTYMNRTENSVDMSTTAITKKGKVGTTYLCAFASDWTPAAFTINTPQVYSIKGAWVTNSTYTYHAMATDKISGTTPFKKGDWLKLTATGYGNNNAQVGVAEIYLANYSSDSSKPVGEWIWFDMTELGDAVKVVFSLSSTDNDPEWGMRTPSYFCMDGVTLEEK